MSGRLGVRELRRFGFATKGDAEAAARHVWELIALAAADTGTQQRIGDLIFEKTARGGELPAVEDVRRRLGLRRRAGPARPSARPGRPGWPGGARRATATRTRLAQHGRNWLLPVLADVALDRLTGEHCAMVFERIDMFNEEIEAAREAERKPVLPGDVRLATRYTGVATQHWIYGVLRKFLNDQWKKAHKIPFNPVYMVELEAGDAAPRRWYGIPTRWLTSWTSPPMTGWRCYGGSCCCAGSGAARCARSPTSTSTPPGPP